MVSMAGFRSEVTGSVALGVILSSFVFSLGHGYEGTAGVASVGAMGLIFALVYVWRQSLVAPVTMPFRRTSSASWSCIVVIPQLAGK